MSWTGGDRGGDPGDRYGYGYDPDATMILPIVAPEATVVLPSMAPTEPIALRPYVARHTTEPVTERLPAGPQPPGGGYQAGGVYQATGWPPPQQQQADQPPQRPAGPEVD